MAEELTWYYGQNDQQRGPVTLGQLQELLRARQLAPDDLVWREGMAQWTAAAQVHELYVPIPPVPPPPPHVPPPAYGPPYFNPPPTNFGPPVPRPFPTAQAGDGSSTAVWAFVVALIGLFTHVAAIIFGAVAILMSLKAQGQMRAAQRAPGPPKGKGYAIAAVVIGIIDVLGALGLMSNMHHRW